MVDVDRSPRTAQFVLRPNQSLSWRETRLIFFCLCVVCGGIAIAMTLQGFWLILPFAGLELLAVGAGLYIVAQRCQTCEVIRITEDAIRIERGRRYPEQHWTLTRLWARVVLERCPKQWYPSRLWIRSHGQAIEIGRFLNEEEKQRLAAELSRSL